MIIPIIISSIFIVGYNLYAATYKVTVSNYENSLLEKDKQIESMKSNVYMPIKSLNKGTSLNDEDFIQIECISDMDMSIYMSEEDFGKISVIDLPSGEPVLKSSLITEDIKADVREEEFSMFFLATNLREGDSIDLRIQFTNGEDYIVLSKKVIRSISLENNTVWLWLSEDEINRISSAIVDAYLHKGTRLYTVTYVEPNIQNPAVVTYPVNSHVKEVMLENPNILEEARQLLSNEQRVKLEERLQTVSEEVATDMESSLNIESDKRQQLIKEKTEPIEASLEVQETSEEDTVDSSRKENDSEYFND